MLKSQKKVPYHDPNVSTIQLNFIYSEKAKKMCEISTLLLSYLVPVNSKVDISQNFVAFTECMNFKEKILRIVISHPFFEPECVNCPRVDISKFRVENALHPDLPTPFDAHYILKRVFCVIE